MAHGQEPGMLQLDFFFSRNTAAVEDFALEEWRRGRCWAKKSLGSTWLPSRHGASGAVHVLARGAFSGAVQLLARGGFRLPFMCLFVLVRGGGLRLDGHCGRVLLGHSGGVDLWQPGVAVDEAKECELALRVPILLLHHFGHWAFWR